MTPNLLILSLFSLSLTVLTSHHAVCAQQGTHELTLHPETNQCFSPFCSMQSMQDSLNETLTRSRFAPCDESDIGVYFSTCENGKKDLIQFYKPPSMCDSSKGKSLHAPLALPCDFSSCRPGEFLSISSEKCEKCPKGSYHMGPVWFFANATHWPAETVIKEYNVNQSVRTMSADHQSALFSSNDAVSSESSSNVITLVHNNPTNPEASSYTDLTYRILLSQVPVQLKFDFRVSGGEKEETYANSYYRWLLRNTGEILVRSTKEGRHDNTLLHESIVDSQNQWDSREVAIQERGVYEISFRFNRQFTREDAWNGMSIRDLRLEGYSDHITSCLPCPAGTFASNEGSTSCTPCSPNTFSSTSGSAQCEACPPGKNSFHGSATCHTQNLPCTTDDFFSVETVNSCFNDAGHTNPNGERKLKYQWIEPRICSENATDAVQLPADETLTECPSEIPTCAASQIARIADDHFECAHCTGLQVPSTEKRTACMECPKNSIPSNQTLVVSNFVRNGDLLKDFSTGCAPQSQCQSGGFRKTTSFMDSGVGNGKSSSYVEFSADSSHHFTGSLMLNYSLHCVPGKARASFFVDNVLFHSTECEENSCSSNSADLVEKSLLIALRPAHKSLIRVQYDSLESTFSNQCDMLKIHSIEFRDIGRGGYSACDFCAPGMHLTDVEGKQVCVKCEPGWFAPEGENCQKCAANTYNPNYGASKCLSCPSMMTSFEGSISCHYEQNPLELSLGGEESQMQTYNWTSLVEKKINAHRIILSGNSESDKKLIFALPTKHEDFQNDPERDTRLRYPRAVCPPNSLACLETKVNGIDEIFSLADVSTVVEEQENSLRRSSSEEPNMRTLRLWKENNPLCGGNTSVVDLNFVCQPHATPIIVAKQVKNCTFTVDVQSIDSCPICQPSHYTLIKSTECVNNRLSKHWTLRKDAPLCSSIVGRPADDWEWCVTESILYLAWVIPLGVVVFLCCTTCGCCVGLLSLKHRVKTLQEEKMHLLKHQQTHVELKDNQLDDLKEDEMVSTP